MVWVVSGDRHIPSSPLLPRRPGEPVRLMAMPRPRAHLDSGQSSLRQSTSTAQDFADPRLHSVPSSHQTSVACHRFLLSPSVSPSPGPGASYLKIRENPSPRYSLRCVRIFCHQIFSISARYRKPCHPLYSSPPSISRFSKPTKGSPFLKPHGLAMERCSQKLETLVATF